MIQLVLDLPKKCEDGVLPKRSPPLRSRHRGLAMQGIHSTRGVLINSFIFLFSLGGTADRDKTSFINSAESETPSDALYRQPHASKWR